MNQDTTKSALNKRLEQFKQKIRREEKETYFKKIRNQLIEHHEINAELQGCSEMIFEDYLEQLSYPFQSVYKLDKTGLLFCKLTGWPAQNLHNLSRLVLREELEMVDKMELESSEHSPSLYWGLKDLKESELTKLEQLWQFYAKWSYQNDSRLSDRLFQLIKHSHPKDLIHRKFLEWVGVLVNFLLLGNTIRQILLNHGRFEALNQYNQQTQVLVGIEFKTFMEGHIRKCETLLINLLACEDDFLLHQHLLLINDIIGVHLPLVDLYYNMLLIKGLHTEIRNKIVTSYLRILENEQAEFMSKHHEFVFILYFSYANRTQTQNEHYTAEDESLDNKVINIINDLLRMINLQYENNCNYYQNNYPQLPNEESHRSILCICKIIKQILRRPHFQKQHFIQSKHIFTMFKNHLALTDSETANKITSEILLILAFMTFDSDAFHVFEEQPVIESKIFLLLNRFEVREKEGKLQIGYESGKGSVQEVLKNLLCLMGNLCKLGCYVSMFLQKNWLQSICSLMLIHYQSSKINTQIRQFCYAILLNILSFLNQSDKDNFTLIDPLLTLLSVNGIGQMFLNMIKFSPQKTTLIQKSLEAIHFILAFYNYMVDYEEEEDETLTHKKLLFKDLLKKNFGDSQFLQKFDFLIEEANSLTSNSSSQIQAYASQASQQLQLIMNEKHRDQ